MFVAQSKKFQFQYFEKKVLMQELLDCHKNIKVCFLVHFKQF